MHKTRNGLGVPTERYGTLTSISPLKLFRELNLCKKIGTLICVAKKNKCYIFFNSRNIFRWLLQYSSFLPYAVCTVYCVCAYPRGSSHHHTIVVLRTQTAQRQAAPYSIIYYSRCTQLILS